MASKEKTKVKKLIIFGKVDLMQKALFANNLSVMLKAGMNITEALEISMESANGKLKKILKQVLSSAVSGNSLSSSFAEFPKVFSKAFINAVEAGENSGTLVENLSNVAEQLKKQKELQAKIKGAMLYPVVVLAATFGLGMVLSFLVLPKITPLFEGLRVDLPITTLGLIWFSHFIQYYGIWLFAGIILAAIFLVWLIRQKFVYPTTHYILLHFPIVKKISRESNLSGFCRTLGTLLKSGLAIDDAMVITAQSAANYYYIQALSAAADRVKRGTKLSESLKSFSTLFPTMVMRMIKVGEESGKIDETLLYLADYYESEVDNSTKTLATAIEPLLLVVIGLAVAFLALSIITPIYEITGKIRK